MTKVVKFPAPVPEKFGPQRVQKRKNKSSDKDRQLDLFAEGKVVRLSQLSAFEEALMLDSHGDLQAARASYQKSIEANDSLADAYCNLGIIEFQDKNYPRSIDCFTRSLKEEPRHYEAHYNLANLYAEVGDFALAKFHYQIAIEIEPAFRNSYFNLALVFAREKVYKEAAQILELYRQLATEEEYQQVDGLIQSFRQLTES